MPTRRYDTTRRAAAAAARRLAVVAAAKELFERRGWAGTRVSDIAARAGVSQKLVEASFGTKAALLAAAVEYAIRGDVEPVAMPQRERVRAMEAAPDADAMLRLHAAHLREVNARSARIARVVEQAAAADPAAAAVWRQMNRNREFAVRWATETLWRKRGRRRGVTRVQVAAAFWVALDWGTYTTLTERAGLDGQGFERWLVEYYAALLLPHSAVSPRR
jgi:TetR/AcrR family transcriptional regulator, regulator of autoinduction and epiphytic fitness